MPRDTKYCSAIFIATSTDTEPESDKNTLSNPLRRDVYQPSAQFDGWFVGYAAKHDMRHAFHLCPHGVIQHWMIVAVDGRPPG